MNVFIGFLWEILFVIIFRIIIFYFKCIDYFDVGCLLNYLLYFFWDFNLNILNFKFEYFLVFLYFCFLYYGD